MTELINNNSETVEVNKERWNHYNYALLDPRNIPAATENNTKIFETGDVYGIEVTVPKLAEQCVENIDPQHTDGNINLSAIEVALTTQLPEAGSTLATVRADLDSIGAMAIMSNRVEFGLDKYDPENEENYVSAIKAGFVKDDEKFIHRLYAVAESDKFAHGGYPGPKPLPTVEKSWLKDGNDWPETSAIGAVVADFRLPLADRVAMMGEWLSGGEVPTKYVEQVEKERLDLINALETGKICYDVIADKDGGADVAVVETSHRAATMVGYSLAPVVIAYNPEFKQGPGEAYKKYTICQFEDKFIDLKAVREELNELEPGWGGSPTIIGSPQGVSSQLKIEDIAVIVEKHLIRQ